MRLGIEDSFFASQLSREIITGGLTVVDVVERILSESLEDSVLQSIGDRIIEAPRAIIHPNYYKNRFQNLYMLGQKGYSTWYSEIRFSTRKNDHLDISSLETTCLNLGGIKYGSGVERKFEHRRKELKTQVNHTLRLNNIKIPREVFTQTISEVEKSEIIQPYIANLTVGFEHFIDDRIEGYRTVSFDHVVTGERKFCSCHSKAHEAMLIDAKIRVPSYGPNSWPQRVINLLENPVYSNCLCHFCVSTPYGEDALIKWYGPQIRKHFEPYVDLLILSTNMDSRTAKVEAKRRLSISRWLREDELYQLVTQLFRKRCETGGRPAILSASNFVVSRC